MTEDPSSPRLDVWLDVVCLYKTRSQATQACKGGKITIDGLKAKAHRKIRVGDRLSIKRSGWKQEIEVQGLADKHLPKQEARKLYLDHTPEPDPKDIAMRRMIRLSKEVRDPGTGAPSKRDRRKLRDLKGR